MPEYEYMAVNEQGQKQSGVAQGPDRETVRATLKGQGWLVYSIVESAVVSSTLTTHETLQVVRNLAHAAESRLPLTGTLRALAEETSSVRKRRRLKNLYEALERGEPLEQVLKTPGSGLPRSVALILGSGQPPAVISAMLLRIIDSQTLIREILFKFLTILIYPVGILFGIAGLWMFLLIYILPIYIALSTTFGTANNEVAPFYRLLIWVSERLQSHVTWYMGGGLLCLLVLVASFALFPATLRRRVICQIPVIGPMVRLIALSDLASLLAILIENQTPLPKALILAAEGSSDIDLVVSCRQLSTRLESGDQVPNLIATQTAAPAYLNQILRWAMQGQTGVEPLQSLSEMLRLRARMVTRALLPLLEPVLLIMTVASMVLYGATLIPPIFNMINLFSALV